MVNNVRRNGNFHVGIVVAHDMRKLLRGHKFGVMVKKIRPIIIATLQVMLGGVYKKSAPRTRAN